MPSNFTPEEKITLKSFSAYQNLTIKRAEKCGKIIVNDTESYAKKCHLRLNPTEFYEEFIVD